jgi:hypothetical protein
MCVHFQQFNAMGRKVDAALSALGATQLLPMGEGDDNGSLEDDFENWRWGTSSAGLVPVCLVTTVWSAILFGLMYRCLCSVYGCIALCCVQGKTLAVSVGQVSCRLRGRPRRLQRRAAQPAELQLFRRR